MNRRSLLVFIILNVVVTFVVVSAILLVVWPMWQKLTMSPTRAVPLSPPLIVVVTATPDPRITQSSAQVMVVTATPQSGGVAIVATPGDAQVMTETALAELGTVPTLDPSLLPPSLGTLPSNVTELAITPGGPTVTPGASPTDKSGCPTYTIKQGDIAGSIATNFGVSLADLMQANQLTEADLTRLQIGQVLIIPVNGCGLATEEPSPTPTRFVLPTLPATVTEMPTASKVLIEIVQVISPGDITAEGVELHNVSGGVIQMQGWKLIDANGLEFTFPEYRMFPGGHVTVYTRAGTNTPIVLYWGQSRAVWGEPGQTIQIVDAQGNVQASRGVSGAAETPQPADAGPFVPTATEAS
jgi:LysM repeat protein